MYSPSLPLAWISPPQPDALDVKRTRLVHLVKALKDARQLLLRHAAAGVADCDHGCILGPVGKERDGSVLRRKFHRVVYQVIDHLLQQVAVRMDRHAVHVFKDLIII